MFNIDQYVSFSTKLAQRLKRLKKNQPSHAYVIISISLVLFIIGLLLSFLIQSKKLTDSVKENIELQLELNSKITQSETVGLLSKLETNPAIKHARYISPEAAADALKKELGENFIETLGFNPLYPAINLNLVAQHTHEDSIAKLSATLLKNNLIESVNYPRSFVKALNKNVGMASLLVGVVALIVLLIAIILIDNTIKLSMYANRFIIRSMQLVGATRTFIVRPYLSKAITNGFISSLMALIALIGLFLYLEKGNNQLSILGDLVNFAIVIGAVMGLGLMLSIISTYFAVSKYLRMKLDDLY